MKSSVILKEGYIVEGKEKKAIIIPINRYKNILKKIEDLEDALDALKVKKEGKEFFRYADVKRELRSKGRL